MIIIGIIIIIIVIISIVIIIIINSTNIVIVFIIMAILAIIIIIIVVILLLHGAWKWKNREMVMFIIEYWNILDVLFLSKGCWWFFGNGWQHFGRTFRSCDDESTTRKFLVKVLYTSYKLWIDYSYWEMIKK